MSDVTIRVLANGARVYALQLPLTVGNQPAFVLPEGAAPRVLIDYTGAARGNAVASSVWTGPVGSPALFNAQASALINAAGDGDIKHVLTLTSGVVYVTRFRVLREVFADG